MVVNKRGAVQARADGNTVFFVKDIRNRRRIGVFHVETYHARVDADGSIYFDVPHIFQGKHQPSRQP